MSDESAPGAPPIERSREGLEFLAENMADIVWTVDKEFRTTYVSPSIETVLGFTPQQRAHQPIGEVLTEESLQKVTALMAYEFARDGDPGLDPDRIIEFEAEYHHADGRTLWLNNRVKGVRDADGAVIGIYGCSSDITERKRAEQRLRAERERTQTYLDLAGVMFVALDTDGRITMVNRRATEVLGWTEEELVGEDWFDTCLPQRDRETVREVSAQLRRGEIEPAEYYENPVLTKDGSERTIAWHNAVLRDDTGAVIGHLSSGTDVTELRRADEERAQLEQRLHQSRRMEAIGRLAAGVAHDFNNVLTVITANAGIMLEDVPRADPLRESIEEVAAACDQAAGLTRQLLTFSRKQVIEPRVLDLAQLVDNLRTMLQRLIGEDILLQTSAPLGLGHVRVDPSQAEQVVLNLAINARAAMPEGGELRIELEDVRIDERECLRHADATPGEYVALTVSDNGAGMDEATRERIFEPFFSTRAPGEGTGLGLATVYGIVTQHGGWIRVDSRPGEGARFVAHFPRTTGEAQPIPSGLSPKLAGGDETILVVEDDRSVRNLVVRLLERLGYRVLRAAGGREALEVAHRHEGPIDLLLTDVVMPRMNGHELSRVLTEVRPTVQTLFTSGYTADVIAHHGVLEEGVELVAKPFSPGDLANRIRAILDRRPGRA
jgi:two-component system, cell cycle sensor histidine kinase and response regulator CckA